MRTLVVYYIRQIEASMQQADSIDATRRKAALDVLVAYLKKA